jgi:hypothetical protein
MAVAIPLLSVEKNSKKDIQQDDKQRSEEHMQHMEAVATAMFITGPPTKKLRKNATSESTGIIPPSRPPSAPAALSLVPAAAVTIPFCSPSVPKVMPSTVTEVTTAWVAPVPAPPAAESALPQEPLMAKAALMTALLPSSTFLLASTLPPCSQSALALPISLVAPPIT